MVFALLANYLFFLLRPFFIRFRFLIGLRFIVRFLAPFRPLASLRGAESRIIFFAWAAVTIRAVKPGLRFVLIIALSFLVGAPLRIGIKPKALRDFLLIINKNLAAILKKRKG